MDQSIEYIRASDGTGNASQATVTNSRSAVASTILVNTVTGFNPDGFCASMGTPHTFIDPVTSETITVISEETCVDFIGHIDDGKIEIDEIAPGYTDAGSSVGDIVVVRPTTQYGDNIADVMAEEHEDDGTHGAITPTSVVSSGAISGASISSSGDLSLRSISLETIRSESTFDYIVPGGGVLAGSGYGSTLGWTLSAGVVYINGKRYTIAAASGNVSASKDTYFDLLLPVSGSVATLVNTGGNIVNNNAASPALAANSVRLGIIVSGASNIASVAAVNQGQIGKLLPIASSVPYEVTDSLGNLICPRDPQRRILGYRRNTSGVTSTGDSTHGDQVTAVPFIAPAGRNVKISAGMPEASNNTATDGPGMAIWDGAINVTQLARTRFYLGAGAANSPVSLSLGRLVTPAAGLNTYRSTIIAIGGGTATTNGDSWLMVELV